MTMYKISGKKTEKITIRCKPEVKRRLHVFTKQRGFRNLEETIEWLLTKAENEWI